MTLRPSDSPTRSLARRVPPSLYERRRGRLSLAPFPCLARDVRSAARYHLPVPLYDFRCRACAAAFEALVRPPQDPVCPACGSADLEKLLSTSFSVKSGSGLSPAARRAVRKQQSGQKQDQDAFQREIEQKHLDD